MRRLIGKAGSARRAQAAVAVIFLVHGVMFGAWATQIPLIKQRLGLGNATLGLALICSALGGVAAMQVASVLTRRFGALPLLRVSTLLGCLMFPAAVLSVNGWMLGGVLLLLGGGLGLVDLLMNAQSVQVEARAGRPIMSGLHGMWSLGAFSGAGLGSLLLAVMTPLSQAVLLAATVIAAVLFVSGALLPMGGAAQGGRAPRIKRLMWRGPLLLTGAMMALAFSVEGALLDWSAIFLRERHHLPGSEAGLGYAGFAGTMLLGRLTGDRMRARWGDRRVLQWTIPGAFFLAVAVLAPSPWIAIAGFALVGATLCNVAPILFNAAGWLGEAAGPGGATQAVAGVVSLGYAGVMAAPPLFGLVARQSSLAIALCMAAFFCLLLGLGAQALPKRRSDMPAE